MERMQLSNGTTIRDVYAAASDGTGTDGLGGGCRSLDELQDVIHATGLPYDECSRLSVSLTWWHRESDDADATVSDEETYE